MRKIKLVLAYDGRDFSGWQRQKNATSIQAVLEKSLAVLTGEPVVVHSAGRTDAGVHAEAMPVHFTTSTSIPCEAFQKGVNSILPGDIRVLESEEVDSGFHARYDATGKVYHYYFSNAEVMCPTMRFYCAHVPRAVNIGRMTACLKLVIGKHDFSSFEAVGSRDPSIGGKGAVREIFSADLISYNPRHREYRAEIYGDGFLRKMVRNIMGTVFEVDRDRISPNDFRNILAVRDRGCAGPTAPAGGLFLSTVYY